MTRPSARFAPVLVVLAALSLALVAVHRFGNVQQDECADPGALLEVPRLGDGLRPVERWDRHEEDRIQWTETPLTGAGRDEGLRGAIIRSYRPIDLYTRTPRLILGPFEAEQRELRDVDAGGETLPIHTVVDGTQGRNAIASYLFVYDGGPVAHPFLSQLASAPEQVIRGTRPLTVIIAGGEVPSSGRQRARERAERFIEAAWRHYRESCLPADAGNVAAKDARP